MPSATRPCRRLYLDLDGVFADFYPAAREVLGVDYASLHPEQAWARLDKVPRFFRSLQPLPQAKAFFQAIEEIAQQHGLSLAFLTAMPRPTNQLVSAAADKREWVRHELGTQTTVIMVAGAKAKTLCVSPDSVLIDDALRNVQAWRSAGGTGIHHVDNAATLRQLNAWARGPSSG